VVLVVLMIGGLVLAVVIGLVANYATGGKDDAARSSGADVVKVLGTTSLLAGLLVAFVLSGASSSYTAARTAAKAESDTVDTMFESADYVAQPFRQRLQGAIVCYARAVSGPEWQAMSKGNGSSVPSNWTGIQPGGIRSTLIEMTPSAVGFGLVQSADVTRGNQRSERLAQAKPSVPPVLYGLMIFLLGVTLATVAYSIPRSRNGTEATALVLVTAVFAVVLFLIADFDAPFRGILKIKPTAMQSVERDDAAAFADTYGRAALPCDTNGNPAAYILKLRKTPGPATT
jgi:cytochrome bd-type quinol oxidase subunit 2